MQELESRRVQEHPLEPALAQRPVQFEIAVAVVGQHRMADVREMHADLVRAPGEELGFQQAHVVAPLAQAKDGLGFLACFRHGDALAAVGGIALRQGQLHALLFVAKSPRHAHEVALVHVALAQLLVQRRERGAFLRHQEDTGSLAVQAMHELEETGIRPHGAQRLDHAVRDAAAPMHREAGGLVDRDQEIILEEDRQLEVRRGLRLAAFGHAHGRHADAIAGSDLLRCLDALAVDAHLTGAHDPVDVALGHALQAREEVVVDALAGVVLGHVDPAHFPFHSHACILYVIDFPRRASYLRFTEDQAPADMIPGKQANVAAPAIPSSDGPTKQSRSTHRIPRASPTA
jgi:hypothetical protein